MIEEMPAFQKVGCRAPRNEACISYRAMFGVQDPTPKLLAVTIRQTEPQTADSQAAMTFAKKLLTQLK
jgi:hypothetical protein